jgi:hypothetical protein
MKDADKVVKTTYEPTVDEFNKVIKVIEEFIRKKDRIIYGGTALHRLVINKDKNEGIYGDFDTPDIEFYSPEPLQDLKEVCDLLHSKKFKYVQGAQAQHGDTYKIHVNFMDIGDISYVPAFIYNKMPSIKINGIRYIHPKFMYIDYLRMYTDPLMSFRRLEKAVPRGMKLIKNYPLEVGTGKIKYDELSIREENILKDISNYLNKFNKTQKKPFILPNNTNGIRTRTGGINFSYKNKKINKNKKTRKSRKKIMNKRTKRKLFVKRKKYSKKNK